ncbi:Bifunctional DNA-directed RNA polymerase subunit beta-beta', partial [Dissostichus eleginoides]
CLGPVSSPRCVLKRVTALGDSLHLPFGSSFTSCRRLGRKISCLLDSPGPNKSSLFCMLIYSLSPSDVSFRKF